MNRKYFIVGLFAIFAGGAVVAQTMEAKGLRFAAPTVKGDPANMVEFPEVGEIVFDNMAKLFKGYNGTTWANLDSSTAVVPVGTISAFAGTNPPSGYVFCDGSPYSVATYPALAAVLWNSTDSVFAFGGSGNLSSGTFNVPDLRGRFMRGVDTTSGAVRDPGTRVATNGGNSGHKVGSYEDDAFQDHVHQSNAYHNVFGQAGPGNTLGNANGVTGGQSSVTGAAGALSAYLGYRTSSETRPKNVNVHYIIKVN